MTPLESQSIMKHVKEHTLLKQDSRKKLLRAFKVIKSTRQLLGKYSKKRTSKRTIKKKKKSKNDTKSKESKAQKKKKEDEQIQSEVQKLIVKEQKRDERIKIQKQQLSTEVVNCIFMNQNQFDDRKRNVILIQGPNLGRRGSHSSDNYSDSTQNRRQSYGRVDTMAWKDRNGTPVQDPPPFDA